MCFIVVDPPNAIVAVVVDFWFSRTMHSLDFKTWIQFATICFRWPWLQFKNFRPHYFRILFKLSWSVRTVRTAKKTLFSWIRYYLFHKWQGLFSEASWYHTNRCRNLTIISLTVEENSKVTKLISFLMRNCMSATIKPLLQQRTLTLFRSNQGSTMIKNVFMFGVLWRLIKIWFVSNCAKMIQM